MKRRSFLAAMLAAPAAIKAAPLLPAHVPSGAKIAPPPFVPPRSQIIMAGPLWEYVVNGFHSYHRTYAIAIRSGPFTTSQAWRNGRLVMDLDNPSASDPDFTGRANFYQGTETQLPNLWLESMPRTHGGGIGNVPSFRGLAYMVVWGDDLTDTHGAIPEWAFA